MTELTNLTVDDFDEEFRCFSLYLTESTHEDFNRWFMRFELESDIMLDSDRSAIHQICAEYLMEHSDEIQALVEQRARGGEEERDD